jgi:hypothetical protein
VQSPEEVGRLDGVMAILDELPVRDKMPVLSDSAAIWHIYPSYGQK